jgi:hypothetical protein
VTGDGAARWWPRAGRVAMGRVGEAAGAGGGCGSGRCVRFKGGDWTRRPTCDGSHLRVTLPIIV